MQTILAFEQQLVFTDYCKYCLPFKAKIVDLNKSTILIHN